MLPKTLFHSLSCAVACMHVRVPPTPRTDRLTLAEQEKLEKERKEYAEEAKKLSDARKRDSKKVCFVESWSIH